MGPLCVGQPSHKRTRFRQSALEYAEAGMPVFALRPGSKKPLQKGWQAMASSDTRVVEKTWAENPAANVGVLCGNGLVVIDADDADAEDVIRDLGVPDTTSVRTARGIHLYFEGVSRNRGNLLPGVDVRGDGGYVVGAGSTHPTGAAYRWQIPPSELSPQPLPDVLTDLLDRKRHDVQSHDQPETELTDAGLIAIGCRNSTLTRMAGTMRHRGLCDIAIEAALLAENEHHCEEPLPLHEISAICASAAGWDNPPMWITDPMWFAIDPSLTPNERLVLSALARHAKENGWCNPSYRRIGLLTGLNKNTVMRTINSLEARGWISVHRGSRTRSNRTTLLKGREGTLD